MTSTRLHSPNCGLVRSPGHVTVQNRVVKYLVPGDPLFEEAGNQVLWRCVGETLEGFKSFLGRNHFTWNNMKQWSFKMNLPERKDMGKFTCQLCQKLE